MKAKRVALTAIVVIGTFSGGYFFGRKRPPEVRVLVVPVPEVIEKLKERVNDDELIGRLDDLDPMTRKDMVIQMWYGHQFCATSVLNADTGHKFGPIGMGVSPLAILDEQRKFMEGWLADYGKMAKEEFLKGKAKRGKTDDSGDRTPAR